MNLNDINLQKLGKSLAKARKQRGITQASSAKIINACRTTMLAIEQGKRKITLEELKLLAQAYNYPVESFLTQPLKIPSIKEQFCALFREEQNTCLTVFEELCENYQKLEQLLESPHPKTYSSKYKRTQGMPVEIVAEAIAGKERLKLGLGDTSLHCLRDTLEEEVRLRVFYLSMPLEYSYIYAYIEPLGGCLAMNSDRSKELHQWDLSLAYFHFLTNRSKAKISMKDEEQAIANSFAKYFLMPTSGLFWRFENQYRAKSGKFNLTSLFALARQYGVSVKAMFLRLEEMKLLPLGTSNKFGNIQMTDREVLQISMFPIRYQYLAIEAQDQRLVSEQQFSEILRIR